MVGWSISGAPASLLGNSFGQKRHERSRCVQPQAVASDVRADDTAEARRRLARQFRRHKLEPQPATLPAAEQLHTQGLRPRPQFLQGTNLQDPQEVLAQKAAATAAAAAAVRQALAGSQDAGPLLQQLEWQFSLESNSHPAAGSTAFSSSNSSSMSSDALLPASRLLDSMSTTAGAGITKAIKGTKHWRQVQSLLQEHNPELNTIHLCASLTRLVQLQHSFGSSSAAAAAPQEQGVDPQAAAFVQQLLESIGGLQQSLDCRQACNVLWAASKLQHVAQPSEEWLAAMYEHALASSSVEASEQGQQQDSSSSSQQSSSRGLAHAAQLAYSLVGLQDSLSQQQLQSISSGLMEWTQSLLQEQLYAQQEQQQSARSSSQQQDYQQQQQQQQPGAAASVSARDLATLAWSLAMLNWQPRTAWLSAFASVISSSSRTTLPAAAAAGGLALTHHRDLSMLLWATATFSKSAAEGSAAANSLHAAAGALLHCCQCQEAGSLRAWDGQSVSNVLWALATLGQRPSAAWLNKLLQHLERHAGKEMTAQGVSVTLWALAALGVLPQASCTAALLSAAAQHMQSPTFTPQAASNTIWALAVLEQQPSKTWLAGFWRSSRALLLDMNSQGLVNCLWAVARLGVQPPQEWVVDASELLLQQGVQELSSQGLSNVLWAMARLTNRGRQGQEVLQLALQQTVLLLQQQQQQGNPESTAAVPVFNVYELSGLMHTVSLLHAKEMQLHQQQLQQVAAATAGSSSSSSRSASPLRSSSRSRSPSPTRPQFPAAAASSSYDAANNVPATAASEQSDVLSQLAELLQSASLPLLPSAAAAELSILLWSQVSMSAGQTCGQTSGQLSSLLIPRPWMEAWLAASKRCFSFGSPSSRDLAQWLWCLAKRGVRPNGQWLASFQVASFRQMTAASSQDLSNMMWALATLGISPDPAWLQQHLREVGRRQAQRSLLPQHLANIGWALAKLSHRPDRDWLARYQEDVLGALPGFKPQEISNVLWALAVLNCKAEQRLLDQCQAYMAARLASFKANEVAVSLWALARLRGQPELRLMGAALQHCFSQARQLTPKGLSMLMWSVGNMEIPPPKAWVVKLLVATQVRMQGFSAKELSTLAVSLARLEYRPPEAWLDCFAAAAAEQMGNFGAQALANTLWALATLHYTPHEDWMTAFDAQLQQHVSSCTPAHIAMTLWAMSSLQWLPQQPLWQQLQERAELHSASYCLRSQRMLSRAVRVLEKVEAEDE